MKTAGMRCAVVYATALFACLTRSVAEAADPTMQGCGGGAPAGSCSFSQRLALFLRSYELTGCVVSCFDRNGAFEQR